MSNEKFQGKYRINPARLADYDYGSNGMYFVTICTRDRACSFGKIVVDEAGNPTLLPTPVGQRVIDGWSAISQAKSIAMLDAFQLMPNHLHGIVCIDKPGYDDWQPNQFGPQRLNLASIIRGFKAGVKAFATTHKINFYWQPRYHDHVIRNDAELDRIRTYIKNNPANWQTDKFHVETQSLASHPSPSLASQPRPSLASQPRPSLASQPIQPLQPSMKSIDSAETQGIASLRVPTISEELIYFIWQFQYVANQPLITTDGESVEVIHPGFRNGNAGPDFLNAHLRIAGVEWVGTVEVHVKTSDWLLHRHQGDKAYDNVILHIVWQHDRPVPRPDGTRLPTLELAPLTSDTLLNRYRTLTTGTDSIPCAGQFRMVKPLRQTAMLDKALLERLERKAGEVEVLYEATGQDWEETAYRLLAMHLGSKVNADPMEQLTRMVPLRILHKHRDNLTQLEALLFGVAGLLPDPDETDMDYLGTLRREHQFLSAKYGLIDRQLPAHIWKWGKLRPAGFPTMRLAQLARLIHTQGSLFSLLAGTADAPALLALLQIMPSAYWQTHYRFGKSGAKVSASLGEATATSLLINVAAPLLAAYAHRKDQPDLLDRAVSLLEQLPAEDNRITRLWDGIGLSVKTAFDSQASIELYNNFCTPKRCLNCQIGIALVRG